MPASPSLSSHVHILFASYRLLIPCLDLSIIQQKTSTSKVSFLVRTTNRLLLQNNQIHTEYWIRYSALAASSSLVESQLTLSFISFVAVSGHHHRGHAKHTAKPDTTRTEVSLLPTTQTMKTSFTNKQTSLFSQTQWRHRMLETSSALL